jgi:hypothetical protein
MAAAPPRTIRSASETCLPSVAPSLKVGLDASRVCSARAKALRVIDRPVLLRRQANARAVGAAAHVAGAEAGCRRPGGAHQLAGGQAGGQDALLEFGDVVVVDQRVVDRGHRVLPAQHLLGHLIAEIAGARAHVAVGQLEPGLGEGELEFLRVVQEALGDLAIGRVELQRQVGGEHHRRVAEALTWASGTVPRTGAVLGRPLNGAGRAAGLLPLVVEQVAQIQHGPARRRRGPGAFQAAADGVLGVALAAACWPSPALLLDGRGGGLGAHALVGLAGAVGLAEGVPPAIRATVSSSFMAMRPKATRICSAEASGSGLPPGPSGLT